MEKRQLIGIGGMILSVIVFLQTNGWIDIKVPDEPTPVVPVPGPKPDIKIIEEDFPPIPESYLAIAKPVEDHLVGCKNPAYALVLARVYRDAAANIPFATTLKEHSQFRDQFYIPWLQSIMTRHKLDKTACPGISKMINPVLDQALGINTPGKAITDGDRLELSKAFQAISGSCYNAFKRSV